MKNRLNKKRTALLIINVVLVLAALLCFLLIGRLSGEMLSQKEAERWQSESALSFSQSSIFFPHDALPGINDIYSTRTKLTTKLHEAALDIDNSENLMVDAWSTVGSTNVSTGMGSATVSVIAVGGSFFDFHPLRLLSGSYITETDLMQDRVLLDEELSWLLYGGTDLAGMSVNINGREFYIAGVISREEDFATKHAYAGGMGLYMSYQAYSELYEDAGINCYEIVMPEPVKNFSVTTLRSIYTDESVEIVSNTKRFGVPALYKTATGLAKRSMQANGILYPYWENAARYSESICAVLLLAATAALLVPFITAVVLIIRGAVSGKNKLEEDIFPKAKDNVEEFFRRRGRKRYEKKEAKRKRENGIS